MIPDARTLIAEAYRWQRRLGNACVATKYCHITANPGHPDVWDSNHADEVSAQTEDEINAVFAAMDQLLGHTRWRVFHTDWLTPDAFLARLALDDFDERPATIQMVLNGDVTDRGACIELHPVSSEADWTALLQLVLTDHAEGLRTAGSDISPEVSAGIVAGYQAKSEAYRFHLVMQHGRPVAYGGYAAAPNGVGMIEDLFTLSTARRQGIATAMIAAFIDRLRAVGCHTVFLGALATERPKHLYARLGFRPVMLARGWVHKLPDAG